ncbi:MAG: biotin--[acetyl-CoA-carboxylase] ligase [Chloroflexi bacterium HGW-Chloroflexi-10]|nr:MAG: biotin--[acetyl-CoA-carboxylase] ligase [Chloroflexi bacterium HGW-Chloroflexi-10]
MPPQEFLETINNCRIPAFRYFESTESTNQIANEWLLDGAPDGAVVFADHQSAGRGRMDRRWVTQPGSAIAVSLIVHPTAAETEKLSLFSPLAGLALAEMLNSQFRLNAQIKWPNDVLIDRKKTAGILTEASWSGVEVKGLVVGVGINVLPGAIPSAETLQFPATCVQNHVTTPLNRFQLLQEFLLSFQMWRGRLLTPDFKNRWEKTLAFYGETVYIKENNGTIQLSGTLIGITDQGDLILQTQNQSIQTITVGDVHLRPAESQ